MMQNLLMLGLHSQSGLVRKGAALMLQVPKRISRLQAREADYELRPPILVNSFPKSGTHLLDQIVDAIPNSRNYGEFISSMTSSFRFRRRTTAQCIRMLATTTPGELVRAHLFYSDEVSGALRDRRFIHLFIYRDPRDVVLSESHYLRTLNKWHRLHPYFRDAPTFEDAISLSIRGLPNLAPRVDYPNIKVRFERYAEWIEDKDVFAVRFEDLVSEQRDATLRAIAQYYADRTQTPVDVEELTQAMKLSIDPNRSHTYRKGSSGGWRSKFTEEHRRLFDEVAGDLSSRFGFE
jgi:hypothetical protein